MAASPEELKKQPEPLAGTGSARRPRMNRGPHAGEAGDQTPARRLWRKRAKGTGTDPQPFKRGGWRCAITVPTREGKSKRVFVYAKTPGEAIRKRDEVIRKGPRDRRVSGADAESLTLSEFLNDWCERLMDVSPSTEVGYRDRVRHLVRHIGHVPLAQLTRREAEGVYSALSREGYAPRTIQGIHAALRKALNDAVEDGLLDRNPIIRARRPRVEPTPVTILTEEEFVALLRVTRGTRWHALWMTLGATGIRQGEARALTWADVDWTGWLSISHTMCYFRADHGWAYIRKSPKTRSSARLVRLPKQAVDALQQHRAIQELEKAACDGGYTDEDLVFASATGRPMHSAAVGEALSRDLRRADITRHVNPHALRHMFATIALRRGVSSQIVSMVLGHSTPRITEEVYSHVTPDLGVRLAAEMEQVLEDSDE